MNFFSMMIGLMYFVTDCDKTLVHYDQYSGDRESPTELIALPASSGSMKVAYVSQQTLGLLHDISKYTDIICVSGMRYSTMMQRQPLFPHIKYWIVENGGQIYKRSKQDPTLLEEIIEWQEHLGKNGGIDKTKVLNEVASRLIDQGWKVDQRGYRYMIRVNVKDKSDEEVHQHIFAHLPPTQLHYTFNLGYLDIHIAGCGKYPSVRWLLSYLDRTKQSLSGLGTSDISDTSTSKTVSSGSKGSEGSEEDSLSVESSYAFLGDDTNDIEIASHASLTGIVTPCSRDMGLWLDSLTTSATAEYEVKTDGQTLTNGDFDEEMSVSSLRKHSEKVFSARLQGHRATEALLAFVLSKCRK